MKRASLREIGETETSLERPRSNAAIHIFDLVLLLVCLTIDDQRVLVNGDIHLFGLETSDCHRDAIGVLAGPNDVAGWIIVLRFEAEAFIHHVEEPVKADGGPPKRIEIESPHSHILH